MKKIIVFGASGCTGKYFINYFLNNHFEKKYQIVAAGTRDTDYFANINVPYYQIDISKKDEFDKLPKDVYAVINLAGIMPAKMKGYDPYKYIDVNITGMLNILEYCKNNNVDRILYSQSFGDIKNWSDSDPLLKVDLPRNFSFKDDHTLYVMTKNFSVDLMENYHQMYGLKNFVFRLPTIYLWSSEDAYYYVDGIIRKKAYRSIIDKAINGEPIEIWGDYTRVKDMVYVKDFCQMLYKALFVDRESGYYNVGTGIGTTLLDQINGIIEVFGSENKKSEIIFKTDAANSPQYIMDITSAQNELGYSPKYNYMQMLSDMKKEMELGLY